MPGKVDWMARALPLEGDKAGEPRAIDLAGRDVVTCGPDETMGALRERVARSGFGFAFVVSDDGVLLGRLRRAVLEGDAGARAEDVMEPGPSTSRPDMPPGQLLAKLDRAHLSTAVLSDPDGRLLGVVRRADLASFAGDPA